MTSLRDLCTKLLKASEITEVAISRSKVVIYGAPNTGKSSLMNCIIGRDRAITSHIPGTTRDYISEDIQIEGIPVQLVDTAGVRETSDTIEQIGIEQSEREFESAKIRLLLFDASGDIPLVEFVSANRLKLEGAILVINKVDIKNPNAIFSGLSGEYSVGDVCEISCRTKSGIEELLRLISGKIKNEKVSEDFVLLEERHRYHLLKIKKCLEIACRLLSEEAPAEIYVKEIDSALEEIGHVNGRVDSEEILGRIFSKFCVGK